MEQDEIDLFDPDTAGFQIYGLTSRQIFQLKEFYKKTTGDLDIQCLEIHCKGL